MYVYDVVFSWWSASLPQSEGKGRGAAAPPALLSPRFICTAWRLYRMKKFRNVSDPVNQSLLVRRNAAILHTRMRHMNSMKLVILSHSLYWSIHTKDESKRGTAFAFIFGVNWLWHCVVTALFGVFFHVTEWQVSCHSCANDWHMLEFTQLVNCFGNAITTLGSWDFSYCYLHKGTKQWCDVNNKAWL